MLGSPPDMGLEERAPEVSGVPVAHPPRHPRAGKRGARGGWVRDAPRVPRSPRHAAIAMATRHPTGPKGGREGGRRPAGGSCLHAAGTGRPSPRHRPGTGAGGSAAGGCAQTSAALRDSRQGYLHRENKGPIIYTKQTTMSVNKEAAGEGKAIYSNSANFSSSTIKKTLIIFRNNRRLTNRFSRCK